MSVHISKNVLCDMCGTWSDVEFVSIRKDWNKFKEKGWTNKNRKHFCPKCSTSKTTLEVQDKNECYLIEKCSNYEHDYCDNSNYWEVHHIKVANGIEEVETPENSSCFVQKDDDIKSNFNG